MPFDDGIIILQGLLYRGVDHRESSMDYLSLYVLGLFYGLLASEFLNHVRMAGIS